MTDNPATDLQRRLILTRSWDRSETYINPIGFGPDIFCAYCRRRGLTACISRWCQTSSIGGSNVAGTDIVAFDDPPRFGPGGSTLADTYCAYCRRRGLTACIRRWCYSRRVIELVPADGTAGFGFSVPIAAGSSPNNIRGPGGSTLADIYCAYCMWRGLIDCIMRWCYRGLIPPGIPPYTRPALTSEIGEFKASKHKVYHP